MMITGLAREKKIPRRERGYAFLLAFLVLIPVLLAACDTPAAAVRPAEYGSYGAEAATHIARSWPAREAGTDQEQAAADYIAAELRAMGYSPEIQNFIYIDSQDQEFESRNVLVRIPGTGFVYQDAAEAENDSGVRQDGNRYFHRQAVVLARMDTVPQDEIIRPAVLKDQDAEADGIHDNASGAGALLMLARQLRGRQLGYDVLLAFTGAGFKQAAGSQALLYSMGDELISRTDVVYEIRAIYAGDKLYAHSGHNSLVSDQRYEMRRKLYEMVDSASTSRVHRTTGVTLKTNQAGFLIPSDMVNGEDLPAEVVFREITRHESDYTIFDEAGVPIVMFESFEYDGSSMDDVRESFNPYFAQTQQMVRGTGFDQTDILQQLSGGDLLEERINTVSFLILHALGKGTSSGQPVHAE